MLERIFAVLSSAFLLYLHRVVIRWEQKTTPALTSIFYLFVRFLLGWIILSCVLYRVKKLPRTEDSGWVALRTIANLLSVFYFYQEVQETGLAETNIFIMTYLVFIIVLSWLSL